jgi:membrane protein involved in colicin uptake
LPAIIGAIGTGASVIGSSVAADNQIKANNDIASKNRQQQEELARKQAQEQTRQRIEAERSGTSQAFQQSLLNSSRTQQQGAQGRQQARTGAVGTIQKALGM